MLVMYLVFTCDCRATFTSTNLIYTNAHNNLTNVPRDIFPEAVTINLNDNQIQTIPDGVFIGNVDCVKLRLDHNNLMTVKRSMLTGLVSLKWLDLAKNHIKYIEPLAFIELTQLKGLYLSYNQLTTLREDVFAPDYHLDKLTLHSNPLPPDDIRLCWIHQGVLEEWIAGFTLDKRTSKRCDEEETKNVTRVTYPTAGLSFTPTAKNSNTN